MSSFYLELVSNASSQVYPQNTTALFNIFLSDNFELDGSREVALVEVSYLGISYNIEEGLKTFHYNEKFKHDCHSISVFNSMDEFAKNPRDTLKNRDIPKT